MEEKNQIRELYYEHGYSKSKIERVTKHNRRTISNCVAKDSFSEEKKIPKRKTKLDNYKSVHNAVTPTGFIVGGILTPANKSDINNFENVMNEIPVVNENMPVLGDKG